MNEIFEKEWKLYQGAEKRPQFRGVEKRKTKAVFDAPVKVGEVRIFADMNRPFVALVIAARGEVGYQLVPVSPFTVPASAREMLVGERVFQLWNACTAAKDFTERSWLVEALDDADVAEIAAAVAKIPSGARSEDKTALAYERAFAVSGGNFKPLSAKRAGVRVSQWRKGAGWGIAAALLVGLGIFGTWMARPRMRGVEASLAGYVTSNAELKSDILIGRTVGYDMREAELRCERHEIQKCLDDPEADTAVSMAYDDRRRKMSMAAKSFDGEGSMRTAMVSGGLAESSPAPASCPPSTERYAEFTENDFLSPKDEPLSTFGLDVDTSSYALMRSFINDMKRLPHKDSVRLEEYVNYFKYSYPQPKGNVPVAVDCELADCPWNAKHKLLRLGVQARSVQEEKLPPCNLTFLVDVSGSMEWNNGLDMARQGLKMLVEKLRDEDHVAIVTYADGTKVRLPSVSGREKAEILKAIDGLRAGGGTAGGAGIQLAYDEAGKNFDKKANNRVVLVTDGDFNIGMSSPKELEDFIAAKRDTGVFLTVLGVGRGNFQDANMKKLSSAGNGNYAFLDSALEAKKVMMKEFGGTLMTVAKDVKVQVEFNPSEVEGYRLLGYESRRLQSRDFNDDKKDAGEIGSGHTMTAFYEIIPAGSGEMDTGTDPLKYQKREASASGELMTVKLRYKEPDGDKSIRVEESHTAAEMQLAKPSEDFRFASAVAEYALLLGNSKHKGGASLEKLIERARDAKGEDREGYRAEFIRLAEMAELLMKERE